MSTGNEDNLLTEALLDLVISLKRNNDLIHENNELRKKMEAKENDTNRNGSTKSDSH